MEKVDEKGKLFTERVRKTRVEVRVMTLQGEVHGYVHLVHEQRVRDLLRQLVGIARYRNIAPEMSPQLLDAACGTYFVNSKKKTI